MLLASQVVLVVKNLPENAGDMRDTGSIPGREDPLEEGLATLQHSCLENPQGTWWASVHRIEKIWTRLKRLSKHINGYKVSSQGNETTLKLIVMITQLCEHTVNC